VVAFGADQPLKLDAGVELSPFQVAYQDLRGAQRRPQQHGAGLPCTHGDQHVSTAIPVTGKPGWWDTMIGPGKPIDTNRYYVICPNVLGACMGTRAPASTDPRTDVPWASIFPVITVRDMVRAQHAARCTGTLLQRFDAEISSSIAWARTCRATVMTGKSRPRGHRCAIVEAGPEVPMQAAEHIGADHVVAVGVDRLAGSDHGVPPAGLAGDGMAVEDVLVAGGAWQTSTCCCGRR